MILQVMMVFPPKKGPIQSIQGVEKMKNFGSQKDVAIFQGIHGKREGFMIYSNTSQPKDFFNIKRKKTYQFLFFIGKKLMFKLVDNFFFFWGRCVVFVFLSLFLESQKFATRINLERCSWLQKIAQNRNSLDLVQPQKKRLQMFAEIKKGRIAACWDHPKVTQHRGLCSAVKPQKSSPVGLLSFPLFSTGFVNWLLSSKIFAIRRTSLLSLRERQSLIFLFM